MDAERLREIDAAVAEKVMGWTEVHRGTEQVSSTRWYRQHDGTRRRGGKAGRQYITANWGRTTPATVSVWNPSSDLLCAWEVVEKLGADRTVNVVKCRDGYVCTIWPHDPHRTPLGDGQAGADTAPLAISLAALRAVGVEVEV